MNFSAKTQLVGDAGGAGAVGRGGHNNAAPAQFEEDDWVQLTEEGHKMVADGMAQSMVRIQRELEEAQARVAVLEAEQSILLRERDEARKIAEAAMLEADQLRGRLARKLERERDEARAQYQTTHLLAEALAKTQVELVAERDELREKNKTLSRCWREAEQERDEFRMRLEAGK